MEGDRMSERNRGASKATAAAVLAEIQFFTRIMFEHAKFIRGGLDPTREQEPFIDRADCFAKFFGRLEEELARKSVSELVEESIPCVESLRDFKVELAALLEACRATAFLPGELLVHLRKEADFYLGLLDRASGSCPPDRATLGLPDGQMGTQFVPRLLLGVVPANLDLAAVEYGLFWNERHREHAEVLGLYTRPVVQDDLRRCFEAFQAEFAALSAEGTVLAGQPADPCLSPGWRDWLTRVLALTTPWRDFLAQLYCSLLACTVPTGQINVYPLLIDHIRREADYTLDAINRILCAAGGAGQ